jgi:hypothetical protein
MADKNHVGSDFDDFLRNEGIFEGAEAVAAKRAIAYQIAQEMERAGMTRSAEFEEPEAEDIDA